MNDKKTPSRRYVVTDKVGGTITLCKATNPAQAINYVTRDRFSIRVATIDDVLGIDPKTILDATTGVHPDQMPLPEV